MRKLLFVLALLSFCWGCSPRQAMLKGHIVNYHGEVVWIASQSEFTPKTIQTADSRASLVYAVKILVKNDGRLKIGTYGEVRL